MSAPLAAVLLLLALLSVSGSRDVETVLTPSTGAQVTPPNIGNDLQAGMDEFARVYPGGLGVAVSNPATGEVASVDSDVEFFAASLAKLPVLITLYREASSGELDLDENIAIQPADIQDYGSGVLRDYPVGYELTLRECAKLLIKESDNTAWVMLERRLGEERISQELQRLGAQDTDYYSYTTTPDDVLLMLRAISDPEYTSPDHSREMLSFMTDTAFEGRLPASLPGSARVAHKVGTWDTTFSDAGIVYRDSRSRNGYFIVVVSTGVPERTADEAIRLVSRMAYETL